MFFKCHPSAQLQSSQCSANGLFAEKGEVGRGMEWDSGLAELRVTFLRSYNYLIWILDTEFTLHV